jgi:beta-lactam-binding protein with PASTA domain/tRNA A-37 threonylcarbamoyl transferase component Bud32
LSADSKTFGGRYAVMERVGTGGMAEVYRARDELLGREVAVKVLSERFSRDRSFVERFRREAQSAANINHPNIVSLYDYGADNGTYYIVMEFIDGKSIAEIIHAEGPLLPERAAEIAADVAQALSRAHTTGLVHRDIKSSNIMLTSSGQTKVTDFGIARALGGDGEQTMTQTGMVIGTAAYLSPEQAQGNPVDPRSDVYSLGVVLFEMLTGRTPFGGDSPLAIAYKHVREEPARPSAVNRDVPEALDAITLKALAKNPDNRYSSAAEMREDLQRYLSGHRVLATPLLADETMVAPAGTGTQVLPETAYDEYDYGRARERRGAGRYVLIALALLALAALLGWFLATTLLGGDVEVPDVVGLTRADAEAAVEDAGLEPEVRRRPSDEDEGSVFRQDPEAGAQVSEGDAVTLFVSTGPKQVEVPSLEGLTVGQAEDLLVDRGLELGDVTRTASSDVAQGDIFEQDPAAGDTVDAGSQVDVTVSSGPDVVAVPPVVGLSEEDAVATLEGDGFDVQVNRGPNEAAEGTVFAQEPEAGAEVEPGSTVVIAVSEGPEETMPDVTGRDADEAEEFLEDEFGLDVSQEEETEPCAQPPGTVCRQEPASGEPIEEGDDATLYVIGADSFLPEDFFAGLVSLLGAA